MRWNEALLVAILAYQAGIFVGQRRYLLATILLISAVMFGYLFHEGY